MRKIKLMNNYYFSKEKIFKKLEIDLDTGLTVLVGHNGSGKTTLIRQIKENLKQDGTPFISYDNLTDGGQNAASNYGFLGKTDLVMSSMCSSEGEFININIGQFASDVGRFVREHKSKKSKELWILVDAMDSGLSINNIDTVKKDLFETILEDCKNTDVYIIVAANTYELARNEKCFDVANGKYISFKDYEEYRKFILSGKK